jgi:hypothetical protein
MVVVAVELSLSKSACRSARFLSPLYSHRLVISTKTQSIAASRREKSIPPWVRNSKEDCNPFDDNVLFDSSGLPSLLLSAAGCLFDPI